MRSLSIISYFPRHRVAVIGCSLLSLIAVTSVAPEAFAGAKPAAKAAEAGPAAAAGPDAATKKAAREAYSAGEKAYGSGDYSGAYDHFKKAYDLIPNIHAQYWMAMAQSYGSEPGAAFDALTAVVESPEVGKLGEEKLTAAKNRLEELKKTPASVAVNSTPPGAEVSVDGTAQPGVTPTTVSVPAGKHTLAVALKGYDAYSEELTVKPGEKVEKAAQLKASPPAPTASDFEYPAAKPEEKAAPPPPPPAAKEEPSKLPAYITLGVGVVGAGVGTVFGISALSAKSDFNKNPTNDNADRAERDALIADMSFGIALTLGITGIVLLTTGDSGDEGQTAKVTKHEPRAKLDVAPIISHTTTGAAARLTF